MKNKHNKTGANNILKVLYKLFVSHKIPSDFIQFIINKHIHNACIGQYDFINLLICITILMCYYCILYISIDYSKSSLIILELVIIQIGTRNNLQVLSKYPPR